MGKGSNVTVGYWYHPSFHICLHNGPMDLLLQIRGGDLTAWKGTLASSGTISIDVPNLWGGEKAEGGIQGDMDVMFGDADQAPNSNISSLIGPDGSAHRGKAAVLFKGGRYGAMNPYPKPISFLTQRILKGWDDDVCWYPEKAPIPLFMDGVGDVVVGDTALPCPNAGSGTRTYVLSGVQPTDVIAFSKTVGGVYDGWSAWGSDDPAMEFPAPPIPGSVWINSFTVTGTAGGVLGAGGPWTYTSGYSSSAAAAAAAAIAAGTLLSVTGYTDYAVTISDPSPADDRGGLSMVATIVSASVTAMNPAHIIYESLTAFDMGAEPIANLNDTSFRAAADQLYSEGFGLCTMFDPDAETLEQFRQRICAAVAMNVTRSSIDGLWYIDLIRGATDPSGLPVLTDDDILDYQEDVAVPDDAVNQIAVKWSDLTLKQTRTTPPIQALGSIESFQVINAQTTAYPEIPSESLALRACNRDLSALSLPLKRLALTTNRKPYGWRMGTYFLLQSTKRGINAIFLVGDINRGTLKSGAIKLKVIQDNFSLASETFVVGEPGNSAAAPAAPAKVTAQIAFEAPYAFLVPALGATQVGNLDVDSGYLAVAGVRPVAGSAGYELETSVGAGAYAEAGSDNWCPSAIVAAAAGDSDTALALSGAADLAFVQAGTAAIWDDEIVRVDLIDAGAGTCTVARGCADTIPEEHAAGSRIYFCGSTPATDGTEYSAGEVVNAKLLTRAGGAVLAESSATPVSVTMNSRALRPYPPGNILINGVAPAAVSETFTVTWAHRNRVTQADQLIDTTAASITPAPNTRYGLAFYDASNTLLIQRTDIGPATADVTLNYTGTVTMKLWSIDDNGNSLQQYAVPFGYAPFVGAAQWLIAGAAANLFIIVSSGGGAFSYKDSPDGVTWTNRIVADSSSDFPHSKLTGLSFSGSHFFAGQNGSTFYWKSSDGTWYDRPWSQTADLTAQSVSSSQVRFVNSKWVGAPIGTSSGYRHAYSSVDYTTWTDAGAPTGLPSLSTTATLSFIELLWDSANSRYLMFATQQDRTALTSAIRCYSSTNLVAWTEIAAFNGAVSGNSVLGGIASDGAGHLVGWGYKGGTASLNGNVVLAGAAPFILKSADGGTTWSLISPTYPSSINSLSTQPFVDGVIGATYDGAAHVIWVFTMFGHSTDNGATWAFADTGLTGASGYQVVSNAAGALLAEDFGPYGFGQLIVSSDHGATWATISGLSSPNHIAATAYTPVFDGTIVDGGHA